MDLPAGTYRFTTSTDDGVRLWVNNQLIINKWRNQAELAFSAEITLPAGRIPVKMEYYNAENQAIAKLNWERLDGPLPENVLVGVKQTAVSTTNPTGIGSVPTCAPNASAGTLLVDSPLLLRIESGTG